MDGIVAEIIEFTRPDGNDKNLYITNISSNFDEAELQETLYERFSQYGLVYEVQVMTSGLPANATSPAQQRAGSCQSEEVAPAAVRRMDRDASDGCGYYAFVKFYSAVDTSRALKELSGRLYWRGQHAKVRLAKRKIPSTRQPLHVSKCYNLANHYLGFNNWNTRILALKMDVLDETPPGAQSVGYFCVVRIELEHGLHADGVGIAQQTWSHTDLSGRGVAVCRARKRAHQLACEDAFSRILLVIVAGSKVYVEVNTTVEERIHHSEGLDLEAMLTVTKQTEEPPGESDNNLDDADLEDRKSVV